MNLSTRNNEEYKYAASAISQAGRDKHLSTERKLKFVEPFSSRKSMRPVGDAQKPTHARSGSMPTIVNVTFLF